jgi:tetraacyldisaccharide 4'-kinase
MRPPRFWQAGTQALLPRMFAPLEPLTAALTARRLARPGWMAPVPVICVGNVTSGGAGKTTVALDLGARICARGLALHFLSRGYGGHRRSTTRVTADATAAEVGDEPRLLAAVAPTWVGADRGASARAAIAAGANVLLMDDGLQNASLHQTFSLLVIDGRSGFGNLRLLPAGPLREPIGTAARRCHAAVLIGPDRHDALSALPQALPILRAELAPGPRTIDLAGQNVLAVAGIADPTKFFATLRAAGANPLACISLADHHPYRESEWRALLLRAERSSLSVVTTEKDAARLPDHVRAQVTVADVFLQWSDPDALEAVLDHALQLRKP